MASASLALDSLSATGAYSVRKLRSAYSGSCIRVRRSSDNTESDIGFAANALDTSALLSFCSPGDAYVVKWYDQSGNGRDLAQPTATLQPKIVNVAVVLTAAGGKPAITYDGSNDMLTGAALSQLITVSTYIFQGVVTPDALPTTGQAYYFGPFIWGDAPNGYINLCAHNGYLRVYNYPQVLDLTATAGNNYIFQARHETGTLYGRSNAGTELSAASGNTGGGMGAVNVGGGSYYYNGKMQELIFFNSATTSGERADLLASTNAYFGVY